MSLHLNNIARAAAAPTAATTSVAAMQKAGTIEVSATIYAVIAVLLALAGVVMARLVTINDENKRLKQRQTWRETGPLTWVGILIVCPLIWHFRIAIPFASLIGLGVGFSVRVILRILGSAAVNAARGMAQRTVDSLVAQPEGLPMGPPIEGVPDDMQEVLDRIDQAPSE